MIAFSAFSFVGLFRKGKNSSEEERERRAYLNRIGRIVDGQVLEIVERPVTEVASGQTGLFARRARQENPKAPNHKMLLYTYSISGVTYEAAQDVTGLEGQVCFDRIVAGQPVGVRYDPSNPSNSILISDDWSGLR